MFLVICKTSSTVNIQVCLDLIYYCRGDQFNQVIQLRWPFKTFTTQLLMFAGLYTACKETCHRTNVFSGTEPQPLRNGVQRQTLNINAACRREVRAAVHQNLRERETTWADSPAESRQPKLFSPFELVSITLRYIHYVSIMNLI